MTDHPFHQTRLISLAVENATLPEFKQLVDRFEAFELCATKRVAAAFGYLLAKEEAEQAKQSLSPETAYDEVCAILELFSESEYGEVERAADKVFGAIYHWLSKEDGIGKEALVTAFAHYLPPVDA
jgi:hypothetical protein